MKQKSRWSQHLLGQAMKQGANATDTNTRSAEAKANLLSQHEVIPTPLTDPVYQDLPTPPSVPTVHFHYFKLAVQPQVNKEIRNNNDINIDRTLVAKQSVVKFQLKTTDLPTGRDETTSFVLVDPLPSGYQFNPEATKLPTLALMSLMIMQLNTVTFKATAATLATFNADLTKSVATIYQQWSDKFLMMAQLIRIISRSQSMMLMALNQCCSGDNSW